MMEPASEHRYHAAAVAALGASPATIRRFLTGMSGGEAWARLAEGTHPEDPHGSYRHRARRSAPAAMAEVCQRTDTSVLVLGDIGYPAILASDPQAPAVLFATGQLDVLAQLEVSGRVAVVGTRSPTRYGVAVAQAMGRELSEGAVVVVSGLARGIDAAAHGGALSAEAGAPVVAVLGTAIDSPVAPSGAMLRRAVAGRGVILSEVPPGVAGTRWMFAVRNRIMAAMAQVVVVVESHPTGGSFHTVRAARQRGVAVAAVPGSVHSSASAGPNRLIAEHQALLVRGAGDVLAMVAARTPNRCAPEPRAARAGADQPSTPLRMDFDPTPRPRRGPVPAVALTPVAAVVFGAVEHEPAPVDRIAQHCDLPLGVVAMALAQLAEARLIIEEHGWWALAPSKSAPPRRGDR